MLRQQIGEFVDGQAELGGHFLDLLGAKCLTYLIRRNRRVRTQRNPRLHGLAKAILLELAGDVLQTALLFNEIVEERCSFHPNDAAQNSVEQSHATLPSGDWRNSLACVRGQRPPGDASLNAHWQG